MPSNSNRKSKKYPRRAPTRKMHFQASQSNFRMKPSRQQISCLSALHKWKKSFCQKHFAEPLHDQKYSRQASRNQKMLRFRNSIKWTVPGLHKSKHHSPSGKTELLKKA